MTRFPPIEPAPVPPEPTRWPKMIGALCIIYGAGEASVLSGCILGGTALRPWIGSLWGMQVPPMPDILLRITLVQSMVVAVLGILLVVGGVRLAKRRRSSRPLLASWAIARVATLATVVLLQVLTMPSYLDYQVAMNESFRDMLREQGLSQAKIGEMAPVVTPDDENLARNNRLKIGGFALALAAFPIFVGALATSRKKREEFEAFPDP